jgi:hypothetical protein
MEKQPIRPGVLVRCGDEEIVDSFRCIAVFGLRAYFSTERSQVAALCKHRKSKIRYLEHRCSIEHGRFEEFPAFVAKVLALSRKDFEVIDRCLKQFTHALEVCDSNIDLAYSMFVYCIEALAQEYGEENKSWEDYDPAAKEQLDSLFLSLNAETSKKIKEVLLSASHNRLRRRFINFVSKFISDDFFLFEAGTNALPKSELKAALNNLYSARSGFVHELAPVHEQIRHNLFEGDKFSWENEPYFTLNGVIRLTSHVIAQTINRLPEVAEEDFDWRSSLPGIVRMNVAAEYWMGKTDSFSAGQSVQWLSGFLDCVEETLFNNKGILDVRPLLEKLEIEIPKAKTDQKRTMLTLYDLICSIAPDEAIPPAKYEFLKAHHSVFSDCSIEAMLISALKKMPWNWSAKVCSDKFDQYKVTRLKKGRLRIPKRLQLGIAIEVANRHLAEGNFEEFQRRILEARLEVPGDGDLQARLLNLSKISSPVDTSSLLKKSEQVST